MIIGLIFHFAPWLMNWFGKLPGDIRIQNENSVIFIPITSMIVIQCHDGVGQLGLPAVLSPRLRVFIIVLKKIARDDVTQRRFRRGQHRFSAGHKKAHCRGLFRP